MNETLRLADDLSQDYCHCHEGYKIRGRVDPQCESCNTKDWRHQAAAELRRLHEENEGRRESNEWLIRKCDELYKLNAELVEALRKTLPVLHDHWEEELEAQVMRLLSKVDNQ